jgi:hypothetical protein
MGGSGQPSGRGIAVAYPWVFRNGNGTSHSMAFSTTREVARKAGFDTTARGSAKDTWRSDGLPTPNFGRMPSKASLESFGKAMHVQDVLYGSVSWDTRSIWVGLGPKTVSTATVNAYVFDVGADKVVYKMKGIHGRSDEKENGYKVAADILITPLVTAVSGGPATPHEQRAVQIALGRAFHDWVHGGASAN